MPETSGKIGVETILQLSGADREAKAYAFLYAAFKKTEISSNPVRDALDCLIPFIAPHLNTIAGQQVSVENIKKHLFTSFGFDTPLYAIEQLMPALQAAGYVKYNTVAHTFFATQQRTEFDIAKSEIEIDFDEVTGALQEYATEKGFNDIPPSGSWGDALIAFFKNRPDQSAPRNVKGAMIKPGKAENAIVGAFIKELHRSNQVLFNKMLNVFMGVLVEEFISSVSEIGSFDLNRPVNVFYDTAVLLRLLGCSGKMLKTATDELTRYLQDLGFKIHYFSGNETEVAGIIETIIYIKDTGRELEGETAEAIRCGEVSMTQIRTLQNTFPERLAESNVFSAEKLEKNALENARFQIDESGFAAHLQRQALASGRTYSQQNRENDARYLGTIMRLRRSSNTKDLASCGYVFVTSNKFLAQKSRRYLIEQRALQPLHCPPMLSVGQIATIAWLMKDQVLAPEKAGRELLLNCFAAVRPDQQWFKHFREGMEEATGNIDEYSNDRKNLLTLQAARRIAQEESFGQSAIVRELNMVEILSRAEQEQERVLGEKEAEAVAARAAAELDFERRLKEIEEARKEESVNAESEKEQAIRAAELETERRTEERYEEMRRAAAYGKANNVMLFLKAFALLLFAIISCVTIYLQITGEPSTVFWALTGALSLVNFFSVMDLLGVSVVRNSLSVLRERIAKILLT